MAAFSLFSLVSASSNVVNLKMAFWEVFPNSFTQKYLFFNLLIKILLFLNLGINIIKVSRRSVFYESLLIYLCV